MDPWSEQRPPLRGWDVGPTLVLYAGCCGLGWVVARFALVYRLMAEPGRGSLRLLPLAYGAAWLGIAGSLVLAGLWVVEAMLDRRPAWRYALLAIPLIAESWIVGFVIALVVVSY